MRAGLTGLGLVFVATLSASVLFSPTGDAPPKEPGEPLAQLGVAPGPEKNAVAPAGVRPPAPMAEPVPPLSMEPAPVPDQSGNSAVPLPQSALPDAVPAPVPVAQRGGSRPIV